MEITRCHYDALQDVLKENRDADVPEKLGFLRSLTPAQPLSPRHPVDDDNRVDYDEDPEAQINSLFPFTFSYLDLTTLGLKTTSSRFPSPLFIRKEYDYISKMIDEKPQSGHGSVMVTGQPGTGQVLVFPCRII